MKRSVFASGTHVPISRSRDEIERMLLRYGALSFASGWDGENVAILFSVEGRKVKFVLPLPRRDDVAFTTTASGRSRRGTRTSEIAYEAECRRRWRALALTIKAKLEAVATGIATFENEFLAYVVLPNGKTFGEWASGDRGSPLLLAERAS